MRSTLSTRGRSVLSKSKNPSVKTLASSRQIPEWDGADWGLTIAFFRDFLKMSFTEDGEICASGSENSEWALHFLGLKVDLPSEKDKRRFSVSYSNLCLKNKRNLIIDIPGELTLSLSKGEENRVTLENVETDSAILDAIVMGEALGLLNLMKRRLSGSSDLSTCENEIKNAIAHAQLCSARRIAYSATLAAIEALRLKPSYAPALDIPYQEEVDKLVFAAWELYHQRPEHFSGALQKYASTIQEVKNELIEIDRTGSLNIILRRLEEETSARLAISEIDTSLLTGLQNLMSAHKLFDSQKATAFYEIVEKTRLNIEHEAAFKNSEGLLQHKAECLENIRQDLHRFFENEKEHPFSEEVSLKLKEAIGKINRLLYFKPTPLGNPLLDSMAPLLRTESKKPSKPESIDALIHEAKMEWREASKAPRWQQFLRQYLQPRKHRLAQFKAKLHGIAETAEPLENKLSKIESETLAIQNAELKAWNFWRKTPGTQPIKNLESQATLLCALQAYFRAEIQTATLIGMLENLGHLDLAKAFENKSDANASAAKSYLQEMTESMAHEFKESTSSEAPEKTLEFRASPVASSKTRMAGQLNHHLWAEHQRSAQTSGTKLETEYPLDAESSASLVH